MARLVLEAGKAAKAAVELGPGPCVVGRLASCELQVEDSQSSRKHFQLEPRGAGWAVVDLGSRNGTLLNEEKVEGEARVRHGDRLRVGDTVVRYESAAPLPAGTRLGGVELGEAIGRSDHGALHAGRQGALERAVVVEVADPEVAADPELRRRYEARARAAGSVEHPALVAVLDTGHDAGRLWTLFEQAAGATLAERFERGPAFDRDAGVAVVRELAQALGAVHARGQVHGLVAPGRVRVDGQGRVKLEGLGEPGARLRRHRRDAAEQAVCSSPEEARGGAPGPRSDVYALGVIFYQLLAGEPPFTADRAKELLALHAGTAAAPPLAGVDKELAELVARMLAKEPSARPDMPAVEKALLARSRDRVALEAPRERVALEAPAAPRPEPGEPRRPAAESGRRRQTSSERQAPAPAARGVGAGSARLRSGAPPDLVPLRLALLALGYLLIALAAALATRIVLRLL